MNTEAKTVAVVDYGMGNLRSVSQAVQAASQVGLKSAGLNPVRGPKL